MRMLIKKDGEFIEVTASLYKLAELAGLPDFQFRADVLKMYQDAGFQIDYVSGRRERSLYYVRGSWGQWAEFLGFAEVQTVDEMVDVLNFFATGAC